MPIDTSEIPAHWTSEIPAERSLDELRTELAAKECVAEVERDTWHYTTLVQSIRNFLGAAIGGFGYTPRYSIGTVIRVHFYFPVDEPVDDNRRTVAISRTL